MGGSAKEQTKAYQLVPPATSPLLRVIAYHACRPSAAGSEEEFGEDDEDDELAGLGRGGGFAVSTNLLFLGKGSRRRTCKWPNCPKCTAAVGTAGPGLVKNVCRPVKRVHHRISWLGSTMGRNQAQV